MKKLLVISNHPPEKWEDEQKKGWDEIEYIPFPEIDPNASRKDVSEMARLFLLQLKKLLDMEPNLYVCLQGEFTFFFEFAYYLFSDFPWYRERFVFPTTQRIVEEQKLPDGSVSKLYKFKFIKWR